MSRDEVIPAPENSCKHFVALASDTSRISSAKSESIPYANCRSAHMTFTKGDIPCFSTASGGSPFQKQLECLVISRILRIEYITWHVRTTFESIFVLLWTALCGSWSKHIRGPKVFQYVICVTITIVSVNTSRFTWYRTTGS